MIEPPNNVPIDKGMMPTAWKEWFARVGMLANGDSGTTANRPTKGLYLGKSYFDTTLGYPVYLQSVNPSVWVSGSVPLETVIAPSFLNSWVDLGGGTQAAEYWKSEGIVTIRGAIKNGTIGLPAFTLPEGYRPSAKEVFVVNSAGAFGKVDVETTGDVTPSIGVNTSFWFSGVSFRV